MPKRKASTESPPALDNDAPTDSESPQTPPTATKRLRKKVKTNVDESVLAGAKRAASPLDTSPNKKLKRATTPESTPKPVKREAEEEVLTPGTAKRARKGEEKTVVTDLRRDLRAKQWLLHDIREAFAGNEEILAFIDAKAAHYADTRNVPDESPALVNGATPFVPTSPIGEQVQPPVEAVQVDAKAEACLRGNEALNAGQNEDALTAFEVALALDGDCLDALAGSALAHQRLGHFTQSLDKTAAVEALHPLPALLYQTRGQCLHEMGRFAEALISYDTAFAADPTLIDLGTHREAAQILTRTLAAAMEAHDNKDLPTLLVKIGEMREKIAKPPVEWHLWIIEDCLDELPAQLYHASKAALLALEAEPDNAEVHYWNGRLSLANGDTDAATLSFRRALELDPDHADAKSYLGVRAKIDAADNAFRKRQFRRAVKLYTSAILASPKDATLYVHRAVSKQMMDDYVGAIADCEEVLAFNPNYYRAIRHRASIEAQYGRTEDEAGNTETADALFAKSAISFEEALAAHARSDDTAKTQHWANDLREEVANVKKHLKARRRKQDTTDTPSTPRRTRSSQSQATPDGKSTPRPGPPPSSSSKSRKKTPKSTPRNHPEEDPLFRQSFEFLNTMGSAPGPEAQQQAQQEGSEWYDHSRDGTTRTSRDAPPPDHYAILGVARDATVEEIKRAYKIASLHAHPDKPTGSHQKMALLNHAKDVLTNQT